MSLSLLSLITEEDLIDENVTYRLGWNLNKTWQCGTQKPNFCYSIYFLQGWKLEGLKEVAHQMVL